VKPESKKDLYKKVTSFLKNDLHLEDADSMMTKIDTVGDKDKKDRHVIVAFQSRDDLSTVFSLGPKLKGNKDLSMSLQIPMELQARRSSLYKQKNDIQEREPNAEVKVKNDTLTKNRAVIRDLVHEADSCKPHPTRLTTIADEAIKLRPVVVQGDLIGPYQGSYFQGHYVPLQKKTQLQDALVAIRNYKSTASATHNIYVLKIGRFHKIEDDGEHYAAKQLLPLFKRNQNGLLLVSRFYGGHHLGKKRFDYIKAAAQNALDLSSH